MTVLQVSLSLWLLMGIVTMATACAVRLNFSVFFTSTKTIKEDYKKILFPLYYDLHEYEWSSSGRPRPKDTWREYFSRLFSLNDISLKYVALRRFTLALVLALLLMILTRLFLSVVLWHNHYPSIWYVYIASRLYLCMMFYFLLITVPTRNLYIVNVLFSILAIFDFAYERKDEYFIFLFYIIVTLLLVIGVARERQCQKGR